ncbi:HAD family hydrolase [Nocardia sp. NBC_01009]|uniref:HAD family hydrolase n=1 Tax=Nocardia sp. NBC_01009 TaxID=2975996 RepID=UPI00386A7FFB|nr:haloacid dehalogenase-like hydrolase [Nocardia sp. NBC_01009]
MTERREAGTHTAEIKGKSSPPDDAPLASWRDGAAKAAVVGFVERVTAEGVPSEDRVAVFDNDGTLWCEKPMPIQLDFILRRLVAMAEQDQNLRTRQPWQAAYAQDYGWLNDVITRHYHGDDNGVKVLAAGVLTAFAEVTVEEFEAQADQFLRTARHPTLDRDYLACRYAPMLELLDYLAANGFRNYIVSGGGRDFMRPISQDVYGIPRQRVIGSGVSLAWKDDGRSGAIVRKPEADVLDDGPEKPVRIWNRVGGRPLLAAGNSNGDIPMLQFSQRPDRPSLRLLLRHDDAAREFDYIAGAEQALELAGTHGWTVVSIKHDWTTVF